MARKLNITISGPAGSGKTVAAAVLIEFLQAAGATVECVDGDEDLSRRQQELDLFRRRRPLKDVSVTILQIMTNHAART